MDENTVPNYRLTKTNGGKTNIQLQIQTNSPKAKSESEKMTRKNPKDAAFQIKCKAIRSIMVKNPQP